MFFQNKMINIDKSKLREDLRELSENSIIEFINIAYPKYKIVEKIICEPSAVIGATGERNIMQILENNDKGFCIKKVKLPHSGDLLIFHKSYPNISIMLEVKNYSKSVPQEQYQKFLNDLENTKYAGGIFISNVSLSGHSDFEIARNTMIISNFNAESLIPLIYMFWQKIIIENNYKFANKDVAIINVHERIAQTLESVILIRNSLKSMQKKIISEISTIDNKCGEILEKTNTELANINKIMFGNEVTITIANYDLPTDEVLLLNKLPGLRDRIITFLKTVFPNPPLSTLCTKNNKMQFSLDGKNIIINCLKTVINIIFVPSSINFSSFNGEIKYDSLHATVSINSKNANSDILDRIISIL